jgi:hypothetical protein
VQSPRSSGDIQGCAFPVYCKGVTNQQARGSWLQYLRGRWMSSLRGGTHSRRFAGRINEGSQLPSIILSRH